MCLVFVAGEEPVLSYEAVTQQECKSPTAVFYLPFYSLKFILYIICLYILAVHSLEFVSRSRES